MSNSSSASDPSMFFESKPHPLKLFWKEIKIPLLIILGIVSVTLGTIGYQKRFIAIGAPYDFGTCIYSSLQLLQFTGGNLIPPIPWELAIARWLSPAVTMYAVVLGLTRIFRSQLQLLRMRFASNHIVICGLGPKGLMLVKNFHNQKQYVVVIERDANNPYIPVCHEMGVVVLIGEARDTYILQKARVASANHIIVVCDDDSVNAEIAVKARQLAAHRKAGTKLSCSIHLKDLQLWNLLRQQEFAAEHMQSFRMGFFNVYDLAARQLLNLYPFVHDERLTQIAPHILIVGLGNLGEQLVINAARRWCSRYEESGVKLRISVVDPQVNQRIENITKKYSLVSTVCDWIPYPFDSLSPEFQRVNFFAKNGETSRISRVYICSGDETVGLTAALSLLQRIDRHSTIEILVRMNENSGLALLLKGITGTGIDFSKLHTYGMLERTCKPEFLNDGSHEALAREIHKEYIRNELRKGNTPATNDNMMEWDQLSAGIQEMNRSQADDIGVKLNKIHCDILPWLDMNADKFEFTQAEIEILARMEHERWCRLKVEQGWKFGPAKDEKKKTHPSLLDWNDMRFSEAEKDKDRENVLQIPRYLALAGFQIYRLPQVTNDN